MTAVIARAAIAPLLAEPTLRAEQVSQLVLGETAEVLETAGEWRRVRTSLDRYVGWVHAGYCAELDDAAGEAWAREAQGWSYGATLRMGEARVRLPLRARVALDGDTVRLPDGRRARVVDGTVEPAAATVAAARAKAPERWALEHFAGSPYEWGGVTPCGVDCSGVVQTTFLARGVTLPRDSISRPPAAPRSRPMRSGRATCCSSGAERAPHHPRGLRRRGGHPGALHHRVRRGGEGALAARDPGRLAPRAGRGRPADGGAVKR